MKKVGKLAPKGMKTSEEVGAEVQKKISSNKMGEKVSNLISSDEYAEKIRGGSNG